MPRLDFEYNQVLQVAVFLLPGKKTNSVQNRYRTESKQTFLRAILKKLLHKIFKPLHKYELRH